MKLKYSKILLFLLPLNILVTSYHEHNKNKIYIAPHHTPRYTSRVLSEGDTQSSIYDNDEDMESVKEIFERRTSQRLREYDERMKDKRQKRKEERDENIKKIIEKDKKEKSLTEKVEKCCLRCGCALGGVAASVGLFGGLGTYGWKMGAVATAEKVGAAKGLAAAKDIGDVAGIQKLISELKGTFGIEELFGDPLVKAINPKNYFDADLISKAVIREYESWVEAGYTCEKNLQFGLYISMGRDRGTGNVVDGAKLFVGEAVDIASKETLNATESQIAIAKASELEKVTTASTQLYSAIGYSVLAILIIVLVMIIIYLILGYRRKKKMNKKAQYTKLLNE
ncbi:rifin [Plasmodium reichenowi]|uniref:Rifin n=1 Tax=Plasmodium reichenowi TaxID=5854 RepID=A0A060RMM8_PLARE|nr:rifin [Plasmodium reichenowi]